MEYDWGIRGQTSFLHWTSQEVLSMDLSVRGWGIILATQDLREDGGRGAKGEPSAKAATSS